MTAAVGDRVVVAGLSGGGDAQNRVCPEEFSGFVSGHEEHPARSETLSHAKRDCAAREVFEVSADALMASGVDRAREFVDFEDARIGFRHAGSRLVEGDVSVNADSAEADFDSARVFDHLREILKNLRLRKDDLLFRHEQLRADAVEEEAADLTAEAQRAGDRG